MATTPPLTTPQDSPASPDSSRDANVALAALRGLRPKQWLKNVLVFAAPLGAGAVFEPEVLKGTLVAFVCFCAAASGTYLINDIRDRHMDRVHPVKRNRPIASGALPVPAAAAVAAILVGAGVAGAFLQTTTLGWTVLAYAVFTLSYSLGLKHEPVLELGLLSMGFMLRAVAGGAATGIELSSWFLIVAGFGSLFMAAGKRFSELARVERDDEAVGRRSLEGYSLNYLRFVWGMAAAVTVTAYCLWAFDVAGGNQSPPWSLFSIFPLVVGLLRYARDIDAAAAEAPESTVLRDHVLLGAGIVWVVLFGLGAHTG
jgi:decaprenyl-phosphate phosphoribosyltransferase